jgi:hypothetical protein
MKKSVKIVFFIVIAIISLVVGASLMALEMMFSSYMATCVGIVATLYLSYMYAEQ